MEYTFVQSTSLDAVAYDPATSTLRVRFKHGSEYEYYGVPHSVFVGILSASSAGRYLDQYVKKAGYRYSQIR